MPRPRLVRRREILVPTAFGWLVLAVLVLALGAALGRAVYPYLAPTSPIGGGLLVVEGWAGPPAFDEAARRFRAGGYARIATTGGPIERETPLASEPTWADYAANGLRARGLAADVVTSVPAPASAQERTFRSAVTLRDWIAAEHLAVDRIDVVTRGPHARRTRRLYELAFDGDARIGIVSARPDEYDPAHWWRSSEGAKNVLGEAIGWGWTLCCFHPGPRGSREEAWGP